ncbi:MAG: 2-oxo-4-hydroxy-4-carboxy-5-ureidoimidazoline decarboxylase [Actinomycetota bacterium]
MKLSSFNSLPASEAAALLRPCVDNSRWVAELVAARPFGGKEQLLAAAATAAEPWSEAEIDAALARHPRIGERAEGTSAEADMSRGEQAGVSGDAAVQAELRRRNRAYEEKFGRVFLIRAAGRSTEDILKQLNSRLDNSPEEEIVEVGRQLREIALLRLEGVIEP